MKELLLCIVISVVMISGTGLYGCKETGGMVGTRPVSEGKERILPNIVITEPQFVGDGKVLKTSPIELAGLIFGDIDTIYWTNNRGGSGMAEGTINWRIRGVELQPGDNIFAISAKDRSTGTIYKTELKVTYIP